MTEVKIRLWIDGKEIDLEPKIRGLLESAVARSVPQKSPPKSFFAKKPENL